MNDFYNESEAELEKQNNSSMESAELENGDSFSLPKELQAKPDSGKMLSFFVVEVIALFAPMILCSVGFITKSMMTVIYVPVVIAFIIIPTIKRYRAKKKMNF